MARQYFTESHEILRKTVRRFVEREILPYVDAWEEAESFPRELYKKAGEQGLLALGYPEEYGGVEADVFHAFALTEELARSATAGVHASLLSHGIALPPIVRYGNEEQKRRLITPVISGEKIAALAVTEPNAGSDVASIETRAVRDGDHYIVNGAKTYITSGVRADFLTAVVRTGGPGYEGISLLVIERDSPGYAVTKNLKKMGWWCSDTAELSFTDCRVPAKNLLGEENSGFRYLMENFQGERTGIAIMAVAHAQVALDETIKYVRERHTFGRPLAARQVIRHRIVDMATKLDAAREYVYRIGDRIQAGESCVKEVSMAKNIAVEAADFVVNEAVQLHGGMGYMRESRIERIFRDNRILGIGGGTTEIMKEIISKMIGLE